jgi:hypothetical protein
VFDGNAGDVLTMQSDGKAKFLPGGGGGELEPLTLDLFVDSGRVGSTQDGSIGEPMLSIQAGIDAIVASGAGRGSLLVASGDYSTEELTCPIDISIIAIGAPVTVALLGTEVAPVPGVSLYNVHVAAESFLIGGSHPTRVEGGGLHGAVSMTGEPRLEGLNATFGLVTCIDVLGAISFRGCEVGAVLGAEGGFHADRLDCWDTHIAGDVDVETAFMHMSTVDGSLTAHTATLEQTGVADGLTVATVLTADTFSLRAARANVFTPNPLPLSTVVTDHTVSQGVIAVPAIEQGSFADVTISGAGFFGKENDPLVVSLGTSLALPREANLGIANAWINAAGDIVVRFFGTTAGATQVINFANVPSSP